MRKLTPAPKVGATDHVCAAPLCLCGVRTTFAVYLQRGWSASTVCLVLDWNRVFTPAAIGREGLEGIWRSGHISCAGGDELRDLLRTPSLPSPRRASRRRTFNSCRCLRVVTRVLRLKERRISQIPRNAPSTGLFNHEFREGGLFLESRIRGRAGRFNGRHPLPSIDRGGRQLRAMCLPSCIT
ncbi:hypothetical protein J6590_042939 [Homalodisca vitripennis]|nr:hypothetical protein J6590_042939 [Homalodisca vitripennis]